LSFSAEEKEKYGKRRVRNTNKKSRAWWSTDGV